MALNLQLIGAYGRMGMAITEVAPELDAEIISACGSGDDPAEDIAQCDAIIDFSVHQMTESVAHLAVENKIPLVIGTTGHSEKQQSAIYGIVNRKIPVVWAGNYSVGVNTLNYLTRRAAAILGEKFEPEVLELHHHHKKDSPSGTAERLIEIIRDERALEKKAVVHGRSGIVGARPSKEVGVHAVRGGDIVGEHTVFFCGMGERIELTHRATDRRIFARGSIQAAKWSIGQKAGIYNMEDVLGLSD